MKIEIWNVDIITNVTLNRLVMSKYLEVYVSGIVVTVFVILRGRNTFCKSMLETHQLYYFYEMQYYFIAT